MDERIKADEGEENQESKGECEEEDGVVGELFLHASWLIHTPIYSGRAIEVGK